jgi:hypothetical protein
MLRARTKVRNAITACRSTSLNVSHVAFRPATDGQKEESIVMLKIWVGASQSAQIFRLKSFP